jgi:hypothetical protein
MGAWICEASEGGAGAAAAKRKDGLSFRSSGIAERMSRCIPSRRWTRNTATVAIFEALLGPLPRNTVRHSSRNTSAVGQSGQETAGREQRRVGGNISDAAPRLGPARPARSNLIRVLGQQDVTRTRSPRSRFGVRLVRFPSGNLACARNRCESEKGVAGKEQRWGGHSDAAPYPEMLGRRRTQAGEIIRTDSQRNVSRGNRVGWAIFRGRAPHPILKFFGAPRPSGWDPSVAT